MYVLKYAVNVQTTFFFLITLVLPASTCTLRGDRCVFPFRFQGSLHYECITLNSKGEEDAFSPWCATGVDPVSLELSSRGAWGRCRPCKKKKRRRKKKEEDDRRRRR